MGGEGLIAHVEPRKSILSRADNLSRRKEQLIAANIDQVLITVSVVEPQIKPSLIDRYIIAAHKGNMDPIVIVNKIDLLETEKSENQVLVETERILFEELCTAYASVQIPVIAVSTLTGDGLDDLRAIMKDKASVFSGQSGVGKSSLINAITGLNLETRDIVEKTRKGAHTTTTAKLLPLEFGGWCIDTPGIKSFGVWDLKKDEIEAYFSEIHAHGRGCRYPDCSHLHESGCAVRLALEKEQISPMRYESYVALIDSVSQEHLRR
jgi:ribosome biogenesis GTPase